VTTLAWQREKDRMHLSLPKDLDLTTAPTLMERLREGLRAGSEIRIDASAVDTVSSACIQALLAATRDSALGKVRLVITSPSTAMEEAVSELGLRDWLNDWSAA